MQLRDNLLRLHMQHRSMARPACQSSSMQRNGMCRLLKVLMQPRGSKVASVVSYGRRGAMPWHDPTRLAPKKPVSACHVSFSCILLLTMPACSMLHIKCMRCCKSACCCIILASNITVFLKDHDHTGLATQEGAIMGCCSAGASCCPKISAATSD